MSSENFYRIREYDTGEVIGGSEKTIIVKYNRIMLTILITWLSLHNNVCWL